MWPLGGAVETMNKHFMNAITRRDMLRGFSGGFGMFALAGLLGEEQARADAAHAVKSPLAVRAPMFPAKAKRVIFVFMHGGPSQVDTFDPKPLLTRDHGKPLPFAKPRVQFAATGNLLKSPWEFKKYGKSGIEISDLFPEVGKCADDLCVVRSMYGSNPAHGGALLAIHTGSDRFIRPSMGSWITKRPGNRESKSAGIHNHLPNARARRRSELVKCVPACGISGHSHWQRQHPSKERAYQLYQKPGS